MIYHVFEYTGQRDQQCPRDTIKIFLAGKFLASSTSLAQIHKNRGKREIQLDGTSFLGAINIYGLHVGKKELHLRGQ